MIGQSIATLEREEKALFNALTNHLDLVAACCWAGFRLLKGSEPAVENIIVGKARLPQFRDAKRRELTRVSRFHFYAARVKWAGNRYSLHDWAKQWESDAALRKTVMSHPAFPKWRAALAEKLSGLPITACAEEADRFCYGKLGGNAKALSAMHDYMEEGGFADG